MQGLQHLSFVLCHPAILEPRRHSQEDPSLRAQEPLPTPPPPPPPHPPHHQTHHHQHRIEHHSLHGASGAPSYRYDGKEISQHTLCLPKDWPPDASQAFHPQIVFSNARDILKKDCSSQFLWEDGLHLRNTESDENLRPVCFLQDPSPSNVIKHPIAWKEESYVSHSSKVGGNFTVDVSIHASTMSVVDGLSPWEKPSKSCQIMELPSIDNCVCAIQDLRKTKNLPLALDAYVLICSYGFESCNHVGNHIVPMFVECGSLPDALGVFHNLHLPKEISWTSIISGYIDAGLPHVALNMYETMQKCSVLPRSYTLVALLKACAFLKDIEQGQKVHLQAMENGFDQDSFVGNSLISMYVKCGSIEHAQGVFNKLVVRDVVSWTSLISGYAEYGPWQDLFICLDQMQVEGISPSVVTVVCSLKACCKLEDLQKGRQIHTDVTMKRFDENLHIGNALVAMYAKCGSPLEARVLFNKLPDRDIVSWTAVICGYVDNGLWQEALELYDGMLFEGVSGNSVTLICVLKACSGMGSIQKGQMVHNEIVLKGYDNDQCIGNTLVSMYAKFCAFPDALQTFDVIPDRDAVSWTSLIAGYAEHGLGREALACFGDMQFEGINADAFTFACSLKACASVGDLEKGREIHAKILERGLAKDVAIGNVLVDMYAKCGALSEAQQAFHELSHKSIVSWTSLISGYADNGPCQAAVKCFEQMHTDGLSPNAAILSSVLRACGSMGAIRKGQSIHETLRAYAFERDPLVSNALISMYANCGSLDRAQEVFHRMEDRDVSAWSTMIKGYGVNHEGEMAVKCFEDMLERGVRPDTVTFTCLLTACNHSGLVDEGWAFLKSMREEHGIEPVEEHDVCMVSLLAKSGHLFEAEMFLERRCSSSQKTWASLLSACKTFGEEHLAARCFQRLMQINPNVAAWYVLLAGTYAGADMWDEANRLEELRRYAGLPKKPASASIEIGGEVHEFVAGKNHNQDVSQMLSAVNSDMKGKGHVPNVDFVLRPFPDQRKESLLCEHAEKLALAFGLIHTPQGATLRVTKSLRMCNDCHDVSKIVSKVEKREIIIRDDCSLHRFIGGSCSCGDMF